MATISAAEQLHAIPALRARKRIGWFAAGVLCVIAAGLLGLFVGPVHLGPLDVFKKLISVLPFVRDTSHLTATQEAILMQLRLPRVVLAGLVGATLSFSGAAYQGAFRNPLADPYLLGAAAGAGLGATLAIGFGPGTSVLGFNLVPLAAFVGAGAAVAGAYRLGRRVTGL